MTKSKTKKMDLDLERAKVYKNNHTLFSALKQIFMADVLNTPDSPIITSNTIPDQWAVALNREPALVKLDVISKREQIKHINNCLLNLWSLSGSDLELLTQSKYVPEEEIKQVLKAYYPDDESIKFLREIFYPNPSKEVGLGELVDMFISEEELDNMTPEEVYILVKARNNVLGRVESGLMRIKALTQPEKTGAELLEAIKKDSTE